MRGKKVPVVMGQEDAGVLKAGTVIAIMSIYPFSS